jgi:hypothetical protein
MSETEGPPPSWSKPLTFRLERVTRPREAICRCGTRLLRDQPRLEVTVTSKALEEVFRNAPFCSLVCLRAFVREGIETLDGHGDSHSQELCSDLRDLVVDLEEVWTALERTYPGSDFPDS